jgi:hypothetical protein
VTDWHDFRQYRGPEFSQVIGASQACRTPAGCQLRQAETLLAKTAAVLADRKRAHMSIALWCDAGGHAFSERDPGRQRITVEVLDEETGQDREESRDWCGECAAAAGLMNRKTRPDRVQVTRGLAAGQVPPAPPPDPGRYDPATTARLEAGLGMGQATSGPQ